MALVGVSSHWLALVLIEPHHSVVMQVRYFALVPSDKFGMDKTLRFETNLH